MPHVPRMPPASRFFARLDRFECACPSCGRLIFNGLDARQLPQRLRQLSWQRAAAKQHPRNKSVLKLSWNPLTQRLRCPWCFQVFIAGLLLHPVRPGVPRPADAPPDARPTAHERAEMRRLGEGYFLAAPIEAEGHVNLAVTQPCSCAEAGGWSVTCPVHGDPGLPAAAG